MKRSATIRETANGSKTTAVTSSSSRRASGSSFSSYVLVAVVLTIVGVLTMTQQWIENSLLSDMLLLTQTTMSAETTSEESVPMDLDVTASLSSSSSGRIRSHLSKTSQTYPPTTCSQIFDLDARNKKISGGGIHDPNEGILHARRIIDKPYFWMAIHQHDYDPTRWAIMQHGFYYERKQSLAFVQILQHKSQQPRQKQVKGTTSTSSNRSSSTSVLEEVLPPLHVVDVGGNIGWYSLLSVAAALAVNRSIVVDVFEPNPRNRYRMCESLQINHWIDHDMVDFHVYPVGVSSSSGEVVPMCITDSGVGKPGRVSRLNKTENIQVPLVSLDDMSKELGWDKSPISILKVDVEGLELEVFQGAKLLFQSGMVQNIFFEGNARTEIEANKLRNIIQLLVRAGYHTYMHGDWRGPRKLVATKPVPLFKLKAINAEDVIAAYVEGIMTECSSNNPDPRKLRQSEQCNLWWRKTQPAPPPKAKGAIIKVEKKSSSSSSSSSA